MQEMIVMQADTKEAAPPKPPLADIRVYRPQPLTKTEQAEQDMPVAEEDFDFESYLRSKQPESQQEIKEPKQDCMSTQELIQPQALPTKRDLMPLKLVGMAILLGVFVWCYPKLCPTLDRFLYQMLALSVSAPQTQSEQTVSDIDSTQQQETDMPDPVLSEEEAKEDAQQTGQESSEDPPAQSEQTENVRQETDPIIGTVNNTEGDGTVKVQTFSAVAGGIYIPLQHGLIKNATKLHNSIPEKAAKQPVAFTLTDTDAPQVLIMHTHTTESYLSKDSQSYDTAASFRTTDRTQNMARVGDAAAKQLKAAGIGVIHDTTLHDHPSYSGSYARSAKTVKAYLDEYPTIQIVLDLHRDAIGSKQTITAPTATVDGKKAAQIMIVSGCDDGTMDMPHYLDNLAFAAALQNKLEQLYPTLTRPVLFDYRKYNQDLTTGSLLIEVGSNANTLEQAVYSGELLGKALASFCQSRIKAR